MATGYEKFSRDDLKKALSYLKRKDPDNKALEDYDNYFRSFTGASEKEAYGSIKLHNYWQDNFSPAGVEERKKDSSKIVRGTNGGWESKGYQKEIDKRKENPSEYVDTTIADNAQKRLKKQYGLEDVEGNLTVQEAQELARKRSEDLKAAKDGDAERDGLFGFLDRTVGRASRAAQETIFGEEFVEKQDKNYKKSDNVKVNKMINTTSRDAEGALEKGSDIAGAILGEVAPYALGYGAAGKAGKVLQSGKLGNKAKTAAEAVGKSKLKQDLVRGATAGAVVGTGKAVARELTDEDFTKGDAAQRIILETVLAGGGDAAFGALVRGLNLKGQADKVIKSLTDQYEQGLSGGKTPEQIATDLERSLRETVVPKNVLADPKVELPDIPRSGINLPKQEALPDTLTINDWQNPGNPTVVSRNEIARKGDIDEANSMLEDLFKRRQTEEDAFVQDRLAPFEDMMNQSSNGEAEWKVIKDLQDQAKRVQQEYGKFYIPEGNQADWSGLVPNRFRAGKNNAQAFDIYKFADDEGFPSVDEAIKYLVNLDKAAATKMNDLMPADYMNVGGGRLEALEEAARMEFGNTDTAKGIDDLFEELMKVTRSESAPALAEEVTPKIPTVPTSQKLQGLDLSELSKEEVLMKLDEVLSGATQPVPSSNSLAPNPKKSVDELLREMAGGTPEASIPSASTPEVPANEIRMNLQAFKDDPNTNPIVNTGDPKETVTAIDSIENGVKRKIEKFKESYLNRNHSAKVTETRILENEIKRVEKSGGDPSILKARLKSVKKYGSDFEKAIANEAAADAMTKTQLDRHFSGMLKATSNDEKELANGMEWIIAKRLLYKKQANPDYKLPSGWSWERLMNVEAGGNGKYDDLLSSVQEWKKEQLDTRLQYGLINKESYDNLMKDPFYIPLQRDQTHLMNNVEVGYNRGNHSNRRGMDELVDDWAGGDINSFFKNPMESMINTTYAVNKNALKNDTAQQMLRLAEMDADNMFIQKISKDDYLKHGGVEVYINGEPQYVQPHKDLLDLLKENDAGLSMDMAQKMTGWMARLKTSSLEYQTGAVLRDITESYIKSQAGPIRWFQHAFNAIKSGNADAKAVGAYFNHAHTDHIGGLDPKALTEQFKRDNSNVKVIRFNKEGFKDLGRTLEKIYDTLTLPGRALGQYSDNVPREIEVLEATRRFNASEFKGLDDGTTNAQRLNFIDDEIRQIDERLAASQGNSDAFSSDLAGIDTLAARKQELEQQKLALGRDLKREQIYQGRDIMNYSRAGRGKGSQFIRKYVMFANTATQSKDKLVRSFMANPGQTLVKSAIAVGPMVAAQQIAHNAMSEEDKAVFDSLPSYMTDYNYVFVQDGEVTVLPKPHELALITNPVEDMMTGQPIEDSLRLLTRELIPFQGGTALQGLVPNEDGSVTYRNNTQLPGTLATPAVDIVANQKLGFNQKRISWGAMKQDPDDQKASNYTYDFLKEIAGNNPRADFAQYALQQYGGDPAKYGMALAEYLNERGNNDKLDNLLLSINPLQDRFYSDRYRWFKNVPSEDKNK